jgi:hypothetical protein
MADTPYISNQIPDWLETAISRRLVSRTVARELCDWAYHEGVLYQGIAQQRVYYTAVAGDTTDAIRAFGSILRSITRRAERHGKTSWGEDMATIWRKTFGKTLLLDIRAELIGSVMSYLPSLLEVSDTPDEAMALLNEVLNTCGR